MGQKIRAVVCRICRRMAEVPKMSDAKKNNHCGRPECEKETKLRQLGRIDLTDLPPGNELAQQLRSALIARGLTAGDLARRADGKVAMSTIADIVIRGRRETVSPQMLATLTEAIEKQQPAAPGPNTDTTRETS